VAQEPEAVQGSSTRLTLTTSVFDLTTGKAIKPAEVAAVGDEFQVTVTTDGVDCAGQSVVTALGAPTAPPSVLVQTVPYIIGPAIGSNPVTGSRLSVGVLPNGRRDLKISTSCDGAVARQFAFSTFEFFAKQGKFRV
jgi:hypothetical protein